jgi:FkbM family methyltransferase
MFKDILKKTIVFFLPKAIKSEFGKLPPNCNPSYSQEGEDLILQRIFENKTDGFFIDVGAHHPTRFSNTYLLYLKGWRGINIDAMPGSMKAFDQVRPEDINIECPISDKEEELTFYVFNEPALNTFSESEAQKKNLLNGYKIIERKQLITNTLSNILSEYLDKRQQIDFLSIDVEGLDLKVLKSINWDNWKPTVILVEDLTRDLEVIFETGSIRQYLLPIGYKLFAKTVNTLFFLLEK